jgi:hypothetical protein
MKKAIVFLAIASLAVAASAKMSVSYNTSSARFQNDGGTDLTAGFLFMAYWSSDQSTSGFNTADPTAPSGDVFLGAYDSDPGNFNLDGNILLTSSPVDYDAASYSGVSSFNNGYVYAAVFDYAYSSYGGSVPGGTYYTLAPGTPFGPTEDSGSPTPVNIGGQFDAGTFSTSSQVVPEPASAMLGVFGVGVILYRRWRSRR